MAVNDLRCEFLPWDSDFFGIRIGRVEGTLAAEGAERLASWVESESLDCVYFLVKADDRTSIRTAEDRGFRLVDIRVELKLPTLATASPGEPVSPAPIRRAIQSDIEVLKRIASESHKDTRFYSDENFDPRKVDALYEEWIEKSCSGWADQVLVLELGDRAAGYISCHLDEGGGRIGLFAVAANARGRGHAAALIRSGLEWFRRAGAVEVRVTTQGKNTAAQRTYQRSGFLTDSTALWYHWWPRRTTPKPGKALP